MVTRTSTVVHLLFDQTVGGKVELQVQRLVTTTVSGSMRSCTLERILIAIQAADWEYLEPVLQQMDHLASALLYHLFTELRLGPGGTQSYLLQLLEDNPLLPPLLISGRASDGPITREKPHWTSPSGIYAQTKMRYSQEDERDQYIANLLSLDYAPARRELRQMGEIPDSLPMPDNMDSLVQAIQSGYLLERKGPPPRWYGYGWATTRNAIIVGEETVEYACEYAGFARYDGYATHWGLHNDSLEKAGRAVHILSLYLQNPERWFCGLFHCYSLSGPANALIAYTILHGQMEEAEDGLILFYLPQLFLQDEPISLEGATDATQIVGFVFPETMGGCYRYTREMLGYCVELLERRLTTRRIKGARTG